MLTFLWLPEWLFHPLTGNGYQFWSGIGSDFGEATLVVAIASVGLGLYRHHSCHVDGCKLVGHMDPEVHAPACPKHHSHGHLRGTAAQLKAPTTRKKAT
jgi:hypothetical protein